MKKIKENIENSIDTSMDTEGIDQNISENGQKYRLIAKKSLGQNFIHAPQIISAMIHAGNVINTDIILEIGPGNGALTSNLLKTGAKIIAIEKDDRAIPILQDKFSKEIENGQLEIIHNDILAINIASLGLQAHKYKIIANIPYYISGELIRKFLESDIQPNKIVIMLQKELAKRIVDEKGSILAMSIKAYGKPKYIVSVPRKFFRPIPNVDSAVISIENISKDFFYLNKINENQFFEVLKTGFAHKRKVLIKNLEKVIEKDKLKKIWEKEKIRENTRAEELKLDDWKKILFSTEIE